MPRLAPVTTATLPVRSVMTDSPFSSCRSPAGVVRVLVHAGEEWPGARGAPGDAVERALHGAVGGQKGVRASAADAGGVDDRPAAGAAHECGLGGHGGPV